MRQAGLRRVDSWFGRPLCFIATCLRVLGGLFSSVSGSRQSPRKILFFKVVEQGATVLAAGAFKRACEMVGRENVYACVFLENREILSLLDIIPEANILEIRSASIGQLLKDSRRALRKIRDLEIDTVIDMEFFTRLSAVFCWLTGARNRVGYHGFCPDLPYRGDLMTHRVQYNPYIHIAQTFELLVEAAQRSGEELPLLKQRTDGFEPTLPSFKPNPEQVKQARALLSMEEGQERRLIVLNPNASDMLAFRKWPPGHMIELGRLLLDHDDDCTLVITGCADEKENAGRIMEELASDRVLDLSGKTDLPSLLTIYSMAEVLVTNDSGPAHFASMTSVRTVVLFGPETPELFRPLGPRVRVIWKALACSPCVSAYNHRVTPCNDNVCMQSISPMTVFKAAMEESASES